MSSLEDRFWSKVDTNGPIFKGSPCWLWTAFVNKKGYGTIRISRGSMGMAHRVSWLLTYGEIPNGLHVLHKCDNPPCVNPEHLFLGTALDNNRDREAKGRGVRLYGSDHGMSKVTAVEVETIRNLYATGQYLQRELAEKFGICQSQVSNIVLNKQRIEA